MSSFSQKYGYKPVKTIQFESMDDELRNKLWNLITVFFWNYMDEKYNASFIFILYQYFFKLPIDDITIQTWYLTRRDLKDKYYNFNWHEVYDFIEFMANNSPYPSKEAFISVCNAVLTEEVSAYRFVGNQIVPITTNEEIAEIETALTTPQATVNEHMQCALKFFSDRKNPNYRNSIKESISAVECICRLITGDSKATLGDALKKLNLNLHGALEGAFSKLYGYTNDADGIRHALTDESNLDAEDARYMLVACSAFVNYLTVKADKVGMPLYE